MNKARGAATAGAKTASKDGSAAAAEGGQGGAAANISGAVDFLASLITGGAILGAVVWGGYNSMVTIQPGHRGIVYNRFGGGLDTTKQLKEGVNILFPWFQRAIIFDVRTRPEVINTHSGSKDLQMVQIQIRVLYKPDINALPFVYRRLNLDFAERVLPSIVNEVAKAVVAQYNASELLTKRDAVSSRLRELLVKRAADFHIVFEDIAITHLEFSKEYTAAVEAKQVAQQEAERAKYIVDRAYQEKRSIIIKAEGEAKAAELIGQAITGNPAFLQLRRIEASKEIANTISHAHGNKVYLDSNVLMLNQLGDATASSLFTATPGAGAGAPAAEAKKGWY